MIGGWDVAHDPRDKNDGFEAVSDQGPRLEDWDAPRRLEFFQVKQKQLNLGVGTERMIFNIDFAMKHSYLNDDTCFIIDVIDDILEEDFDSLLDEGSKIIHSIEGALLEEEVFAEFDKFMAMTADENFELNPILKNHHSRKSPSIQTIKSKHLSKNLLRILNLNLFLIIYNMYSWKNPLFFLLSYHLSFPKKRKTKLYLQLKSTSKPLLGKEQTFLVFAHHSANTRYNC
nr:reverse transcriptase domain-containing protein [Tanacetum cinerariifolium]